MKEEWRRKRFLNSTAGQSVGRGVHTQVLCLALLPIIRPKQRREVANAAAKRVFGWWVAVKCRPSPS